MNLSQLKNIKQALKTTKVRVLLMLLIVFIAISNWILSAAFSSMHPTEFSNLFWVYASLELLLSIVVIGFCSHLGSLKTFKLNQSLQLLIHKLFTRLSK